MEACKACELVQASTNCWSSTRCLRGSTAPGSTASMKCERSSPCGTQKRMMSSFLSGPSRYAAALGTDVHNITNDIIKPLRTLKKCALFSSPAHTAGGRCVALCIRFFSGVIRCELAGFGCTWEGAGASQYKFVQWFLSSRVVLLGVWLCLCLCTQRVLTAICCKRIRACLSNLQPRVCQSSQASPTLWRSLSSLLVVVCLLAFLSQPLAVVCSIFCVER